MSPRMVFLRAGLLSAVVLSSGPLPVGAAPPTLSHLFPAGGQRGTKVAVTCTGKFTWPVVVHAPGVDVVVGSESGKLEITIPDEPATDRIWIRLYNAEGVSARIPFLIGNLPEINDQEPNNAPRNAQALETDRVTINGVLQENGDVDGFSVSLNAGQTLVAALDAHTRLGSPMDAMLQVASSDGTVLADNHDDAGLDPRLAFTAPRTGRYIVRLFAFSSTPDTTISYRGAANFIYRLTLTTGPYITHSVPLAISQSEPGTVEPLGWNIPPGSRLRVVPLGDARLPEPMEFEPAGEIRILPESRLGLARAPEFANALSVRLVPHAAVTNTAPPPEGTPKSLPLPASVTGWIKSPRQTDAYRLALTKGQQVVVSVESRSLDLTMHPVVKLLNPAGAQVAAVEAPDPKDAILVHAAAVDGDYQLTVGDRYRLGGDRCLYRLTARLDEPDFELTASGDSVVVTAEKPVEFPVTVLRRAAPGGAIGPITIEAVGLPPGVAAPAVISEPTGPTATKVTLMLSTTGPAFSGPIRIVGACSLPKEIKRAARTPATLGSTLETVWLTAIPKP